MSALLFPPKRAPHWAGHFFFVGLPGRRERRAGRSACMVGKVDLPLLSLLALRHLFQICPRLAQLGEGRTEIGTWFVFHADILARRLMRVMRQKGRFCA